MLIGFLLKGMLVGIVIAVPVGPVGILCIRRTILDGRLPGLFSGLGAASADSVFGIVAGFGLTFISDSLFDYQDWLRIGGAAFLLYVGITALMTDPTVRAPIRQRPRRSVRRLRLDLCADHHQPGDDPVVSGDFRRDRLYRRRSDDGARGDPCRRGVARLVRRGGSG